jgi:hypothetical protein
LRFLQKTGLLRCNVEDFLLPTNPKPCKADSLADRSGSFWLIIANYLQLLFAIRCMIAILDAYFATIVPLEFSELLKKLQ